MPSLKPIAILAVIALSACASMPATPTLNTLTRAELAQGWKLLFDGKDLAGWRGYRKPAAPPQWTVVDGAIAMTSGEGGGDLMTNDEFGDFDLQLEWKIAPNGNSGVIYRIKEDPAAPATYHSGPEMQIVDDFGDADNKIPNHRAGSIYGLVAAKSGADKPANQWNQARVVIRNGHIDQWLNGKKVASSSYGDDAWRALVETSKFKTMPLFGKAAAGHIALQAHGGGVWFRNIKIKTF